MDLEIEYVHLPFKRGLKMVEHGEIDLMIGVLRRPEREAYAFFLTPPYKNQTNKAFYVLKGKEDIITRYEDLRSLKIGTQLGGRYFPRFDADTSIEKWGVKSTDLCVKMLLARRIDAFINTETAGDYRIAKLGMSDVIGKAEYVYEEQQDVYMILSKQSPYASRVAEFNEAITDLVEQGQFERIRKEYLSNQLH